MNIEKVCFNQSVRVRTAFGNKADNAGQSDSKSVDKTNTGNKILLALGGLAAIGAAAFLLSHRKGASKVTASGDNVVKQVSVATEAVQAAQKNNNQDVVLKAAEELKEQSVVKLTGGEESITETAEHSSAGILKNVDSAKHEKPVQKQRKPEASSPVADKVQPQQIKAQMSLEEFERAGGAINKTQTSKCSTAVLKDGTPYSGVITEKFETGVTGTQKYVDGKLTKCAYNYENGGSYVLEFDNEKLIRETYMAAEEKLEDSSFPLPDFVKDIHGNAKTYREVRVSEYLPESNTYDGVFKIAYDDGSYDVVGAFENGAYSKIVFHDKSGKVFGSLKNDYEIAATGVEIYPVRTDRIERCYDANHNLISEQRFEDPELKKILNEINFLQGLHS